MTILENGKKNLVEILKWSRFFYVLSVIAIVIVLITGVCMAIAGCLTDKEGSETITMIVTGVLYVILGGVLVVPVRYLKKIVAAGKAAVAADDDAKLDEAISYTKSLCKFYGIYVIVVLAVTVLAVIGAVIAGVAAAL